MSNAIRYPFYVRLSCILVSLIGITYIFSVGQSILTPLLLSFLFAVLLLPIDHFINSKLRFPHTLSVAITVLIFICFIVSILAVLSYQISDIASDFDKINKNANIFITDVQKHIRTNFNISLWEQRKYMNDVAEDSVKKGKETIGTTLSSVSDTLIDLTLIPIYTFLILLYRTHFITFLVKLFRKEYHSKLREILGQIKVSVQSYISGLLLEMIFVSILTGAGLYFIGIKYFILLGILTGILNLIPYIGILIAGVLTVIASLTGTPDASIIIGIVVVNAIVQLIDNNILVPLIISSKVQINALVSIVGIIIGGALAGIAGMFLAIPILAILKIIFDRTENLEAWGYLMGNDVPKTFIWKIRSKQITKKEKIAIISEDEASTSNEPPTN
ncbi:AI-2E family transporter [Flavobacterium sp. F-380]|uniref:AI-2E family transporter n=1 Tax=Flavobacterium kayseriense TaxID=2764714 RepID=A0ABR7JBC2_9FLAO|nr:AI-2E family transporter [Flavobacterium kayseriense]MBC5842751.1 AI-2E family transporter [Flavobacterium kayseriense]MBC5849281.1 AI-2E family transporter [Flavobacterium kayseriense]MBU0941135.1 AI-2E family transporter [Bacteroidota bacterium]